MAEELPLKAVGERCGGVVAVLAEDVARATFEAGAVAIDLRCKRRSLENEERDVEENVVLGGKMVSLGVLETGWVGVVEVGSSTVVLTADLAITGFREREVVHGVQAGPRERGGGGVGMGWWLAWDQVGGEVYMVMGQGVEVVESPAECHMLIEVIVLAGFMPMGERETLEDGEIDLRFTYVEEPMWYGKSDTLEVEA